MKRMIAGITLAAALLMTAAPAAFAGSPTCSDLDFLGVANHGEHVLDYVNGPGGAAGGKPAHLHGRPGGPAPGASFCLDQAQSPGLHF